MAFPFFPFAGHAGKRACDNQAVKGVQRCTAETIAPEINLKLAKLSTLLFPLLFLPEGEAKCEQYINQGYGITEASF
jgi:hypothetical protein